MEVAVHDNGTGCFLPAGTAVELIRSRRAEWSSLASWGAGRPGGLTVSWGHRRGRSETAVVVSLAVLRIMT